jgi:NAD(P)-dependent dehydrogenase (short-subunit alcohol dehydrogenase family)
MAPYNAAKSALAAYTASLAVELADSAIVLIDFRPGDYATSFHGAMRQKLRNAPALDARAARVWERLEQIQRGAPPIARAAGDLCRALRRRRSGVVRSGGFFQARVAPWGNRLLPARMMRWLHGFYFRMGT